MTGERIPIFGDHPKGRQIATRDGRWLALATAEGRSTLPKTDAERAKALLTMIAYTGRYRLKDGVVTHQVEAAWNESWVGGEQVRNIRFETTTCCTFAAPNCRIRTCSTARSTWSSPGSARNNRRSRYTRIAGQLLPPRFHRLQKMARPRKRREETMNLYLAHRDDAASQFSALLCATALPAFAQSTSQPIRLIVPIAAGSVTDIAARLMAKHLSDRLGQPVVVINRAGGNTIPAAVECAKSPPDGNTLCIVNPDTLSYNPFTTPNLPYDAEKDFRPVTNMYFVIEGLLARGNAAGQFDG